MLVTIGSCLTYVRRLKYDKEHSDADAHDSDASADIRRLRVRAQQRFGLRCCRLTMTTVPMTTVAIGNAVFVGAVSIGAAEVV